MAIRVKDLKHIYDEGLSYEHVALDGVSFSIEDNRIVGIIGHTGSGKSTLLQHLDGLVTPNSGTVEISGIEITDEKISKRDVRKRIGLVFQYPEYQLFEETVFKDIAFGPKNLGLSEEEIRERVRHAMALVKLDFEKYSERSPFELSGGQKRRVAIAGVIAMEPDVLILDEPTAGLDPKTHDDILEMVKAIHEESRNITIIVSHNMDDVAELCDQVLVMDNGKILMDGTPEEVFSKEEELNKIGLDVPPVTKLMRSIKKSGIEIESEFFRAEDAINELEKLFKKRNNQ